MQPVEEAEKAFARGDLAEARKIAKALLASGDEATENAARALIARTRPDPVIVWLTAACVLFFVVVVVATLTR